MQFRATSLALFAAGVSAAQSITAPATLPTGADLIPFINSELKQFGAPITLPTDLPPAAVSEIASIASEFVADFTLPNAEQTILAQIESLINNPPNLGDFTTTINSAPYPTGASPGTGSGSTNGTGGNYTIAVGAAASREVAVGGAVAAAFVAVAALL